MQVGASNLTVISLGRWVVAGNNQTHQITIYDGLANTVIASVTVDCNGATPGQYLYASITPVTLVAGQSYRIESAEVNGGDQWYDQGIGGLVVTPDAAMGSVLSAAFNHTNFTGGANDSYVPVNFMVDTGGGTNVDESISLGVSAGVAFQTTVQAKGSVALGVATEFTPTPRISVPGSIALGVQTDVAFVDVKGLGGMAELGVGTDVALAATVQARASIGIGFSIGVAFSDTPHFTTARRGSAALRVTKQATADKKISGGGA